MSGTGYDIAAIVAWLLVGGAMGFTIGWILRKRSLDEKLKEASTSFQEEEERQRDELRRELEDWKNKAAGQSADLDSKTADIDLRLADLDRSGIQIAERVATIAKLEASLKMFRSDAMKLEGQIADRESTIASLRSSATSAAALAELQRALDSATGTIGSLRNDTEGYQSTIASLRMDLETVNRDKARLTELLETSASDTATAAASLAASRSNEDGLRSRLAELEAAASGAADYRKKITELETRLATTAQERDSTATQLAAIEALHADDESRIAKAAESPAPAAPSPDPPATEAVPDRDVAIVMVAEIATRTRGTGPAVTDDLKKIHGVGPKLDKLLKGMDITSFRQVANFTPDDIQYVTAALDAFPGRIERDDWMSSAAEEHVKKYGEPV